MIERPYPMSSKKITEAQYNTERIKIGINTKNPSIENNVDSTFAVEQQAIAQPEKTTISKEELEKLYYEEIQAIKNKAYEDGKEQGFAKGLKQAKQDYSKETECNLTEQKQYLSLIQNAYSEMQEQQEKGLELQRSNIVEVIYKVLATIISRPESYSDLIEELLTNFLQEYKDTTLTIKANPKDKELLANSSISTLIPSATIIEDKSITQGGVIIQSANITIDARLENILLNTKKLLLASYND